MTENYDSRVDTFIHITRVQELMNQVIGELSDRSVVHDKSKLESPEKEAFDILTPRLKGLTYGSDEYRASLRELKPALDHHYKYNSHHPEHYEEGIKGMTLLDIVEMFCDWKAATERHADGDLAKSIIHNQGRFQYSDDLLKIFQNTQEELGW